MLYLWYEIGVNIDQLLGRVAWENKMKKCYIIMGLGKISILKQEFVGKLILSLQNGC